MNDAFNTPVTSLKGVGPRTAEHLSNLHIHTLQDVLFHLPIRYEDRTRITPISQTQDGNKVLICGEIQSCSITGNQRKMLVCDVADETGRVTLRFFHFNAQQKQRLSQKGLRLSCFGEIRRGYKGGREMMHPEYRVVEQGNEVPLSDRLTPIYPKTQGLQQPLLRKLSDQALTLLENNETTFELLPDALRDAYQLPTLKDALLYVHRPPADADQEVMLLGEHSTQQRLAFEELLAHQLSLQQLRLDIRDNEAHALINSGALKDKLLQALPFELTGAQQRVVAEVGADMQLQKPMLRLVQGDVGSGKTMVAVMAVLQVVESGFQAVMMAPTELLAEQHYKNFKQWLEPLNIKVGWLAGSLQGAARKQALAEIVDGRVQVVVGTHALFQAEVEYKNLALLVIDEQHRFGVQQRMALKEKGVKFGMFPHQLIMSATPIPRTLAMAAYSDLDCSVIDELPPGRQAIKTVVIANSRREEVIQRIRVNCENKRQVYWVCTLIDESEALQCEAAEATVNTLQKMLPGLSIALVHGKLKADDKEARMRDFKLGHTDLLVATTVIEVGVDVPNASLMIIENAERLGLSQLHQLRGRVGRGSTESFCVMLFQSPLSEMAKERLQVMRNSCDGFKIARKDLEMRGPGEVLGTRQAGLIRMRIADLIRDKDLLPGAQAAGKEIVKNHAEVVPLLIKRWAPNGEDFARV